MATLLNTAFMRLNKRAETSERAQLVATFVDVGPLFTLLSNPNHQVIYGRRGTGKTHALLYLSDIKETKGDIPVYIDMRTIGSSGGIYSDASIPTHERATRLLQDVLISFHNSLRDYFSNNLRSYDPAIALTLVDELSSAITEVAVVGNTTIETNTSNSRERTNSAGATLGVKDGKLEFALEGKKGASSSDKQERKISESGVTQHRVHFGRISNALRELIGILGKKRIWLLLDEWSSVPIELQPFLADLLRRSIFPLAGFVVKIAAIEQRSHFIARLHHNDYLGFELGADISADLNLDDFMVFENNTQAARTFFKELFYKHYLEIEDLDKSTGPKSSDEFIQQAFTQSNVFDEFIRSAEGVPRDAINIIGLAAQRALNDLISMNHVRQAALKWYQQDKESLVRSNDDAHDLLHWVINEVIKERKARAFLLGTNTRHDLIDYLFDARIIHILKRNVSAHDQPGSRFDVYKLDYGCYVDLINTTRAPQGLLPSEDDEGSVGFIDVPPDDYRSIRRAILNLTAYEKEKKHTHS
ncbi:ORC-CDC6 family AAA ATPase [Hymenobacter armeniacus]|uniref:ATP-binding protein n=1 Tax=Hymenobacter armeniacus TaxID=2771358 RepID=A0ABR8JZ62_9BACT|nr:hypothetical protein [Hymenobacter armeniacus]MBD2724171.1 hypothetical protein [Hymenobacter armeniacus]